jgi:hypothetical protein
VTVCTDRFKALAEAIRKSQGMPELNLVILPHPIGGLKEDEVKAKADSIIDKIIQGLTVK